MRSSNINYLIFEFYIQNLNILFISNLQLFNKVKDTIFKLIEF